MNIVNIPNKVIYDLYNKEMTPLQRRCFLIFIQNAKHQLKEIKKIKKDIIKESADFPSFWEQYLNNNILFFTFSLKELKRLVKLGKRPEKELIKLLYEMKTIELNTIEKDGEIGIYKIEDILDKTTGFEEIRLGQVVPEVVITKDNVKYALSPLIVREIDSMSSYTNINLENYNTFSSPKAQRIYEVLLDKFLSQQRFKKEEEILTKWFDVSSLYKILNVRNKTPYKDFKKFYIKKAIENINKKELEFKIVSFEEHKENRRITKVRFILKANKQSKNLLQKTSNPLEIIREKVQNEEITFAEFVSSLRKLRNIQICNKLPFYKPYLVLRVNNLSFLELYNPENNEVIELDNKDVNNIRKYLYENPKKIGAIEKIDVEVEKIKEKTIGKIYHFKKKKFNYCVKIENVKKEEKQITFIGTELITGKKDFYMKINKNELDKFISSLKNEIDIEEVKKENEIIKEEKLRDFYQKHINKVESFIKELEKKSAEIANKMLQYDESSKEYEELAKELTHNDSVLVSFSNAYYNNEVFRLNAKNLELFEKYVISGEL